MPTYTNSVTRTLGEKLGEWPSAMDFSALSIDDGVTDATSALQAGLDSVASRGGGILMLPPGTFSITGAGLAIPTGVYFVGHGETSVLKRGGTLDAGRGLVNFDNTSDAGVEDLQLEGDVTAPTPLLYSDFGSDPMHASLTGNSTIWIHGGTNLLIKGNTFRHSGGYSILGDSDAITVAGVKIQDNLFENCYPHTFGTATASRIYGAWTGGVFFQGACSGTATFVCKDVQVLNNRFRRVTGNNFWMHSNGFDAHHQNFTVKGNQFEDFGLDAILIGNCQGFEVSGNIIHRGGYVTEDDVTTSAPRYPGYTYAVGIDTSGYAADGIYKDNVITSVLGGFIDLDGFRSGAVEGNRCALPESGTLEYTADQISSYPSGLPAGINTGNTSLNGGASDILISNNEISGCSSGAIRGNYAKRCHITGNRISHPTAATEVPIYFLTSTSSSEYYSFDNVVSDNFIRYSGANFAIAEIGDTAAWSGCTNTIFPNHILGTCKGEFLKDGSSSTRSAVRFSAADSSLTARSETLLTRTPGALQFHAHVGTSSGYLAQLSDVATLNIGGTASTGRVTTGTRVSAGTMNDFAFSGKVIADGFMMYGDASFADADANQFDGSYGLIRYVSDTSGTGAFQVSTYTASNTRVWEPLGAGTGVNYWQAIGTSANIKNANVGRVGINGNPDTGIDLDVYGPIRSQGALYTGSATTTPYLGYNILPDSWVFGDTGDYHLKISAVGGGLTLPTASYLHWSGTGGASGSPDVGIGRAGAAGIVEINNGTAAGYRDLRLRNLAAFGTAADSVQTTGGFTGITFISTRTDNDGGFVLSGPTRAYDLRINASDQLEVYDRTGAAVRQQFLTNGQVVIPGLAAQAALTLTAGYLNTSEGVVTTNTAATAINAASGGVFSNISTVESGAYYKTLGTAVTPANPTGYGGFAHRTGSTYWYWNGSAWASIDMSAAAGAIVGADTQVLFNDGGAAYNGDAGLTYNKTTDILTASGGMVSAIFNATGVGTATTFKNNNNNWSVNGNGAMSMVGNLNNAGGNYQISGVTVIDTSRNGTFVGLTFGASSALVQGATTRIDTLGTATFAAVVSSGAFNSTVTGATVGFQAGGGNFQAYGNGNVNGAGNANFNGAYQTAGVTVIDSSRNGTFTNLTFGASSSLIQGSTTRINSSGGFIGTVFNAVGSGTNTTFQNNNSKWSVDNDGNMSMVGNLNNAGGAYRISSTTVIDASRNGTFVSVTTTAGNIAVPAAYTYAVTGGYFGQDATGGLVCGTHTLYFKSGILYAYS